MPERLPTARQAEPRFARAFVLRVWREKDEAGPETRGMILEVESGRRLFFAKIADLHDFLSLRLSELDHETPD